ncbi:MAG: hypothetical protein ACX933_18160 [Marinobacter adhaerens]
MSTYLSNTNLPWLDAEETSFASNPARLAFHQAIHPRNRVEAARFHESTLLELCGCHADLQNSTEFPLVIGFNVIIVRGGVPTRIGVTMYWRKSVDDALRRRVLMTPLFDGIRNVLSRLPNSRVSLSPALWSGTSFDFCGLRLTSNP